MNAKSPDTQKHTPGPWKVADIFQDNGPNIIGIFGPRSATSGFNGHCVAHVAHSRDARLIASAPALLEALKALYAIHIELDDAYASSDDISKASPELLAARAAIAAAEGLEVPRV